MGASPQGPGSTRLVESSYRKVVQSGGPNTRIFLSPELRKYMAFSYRDNLGQRPNFAIMGTEIPERLRRTRPAWTDDPPVIPSPNPNDPFGNPPRPALELDPPERNPYNDPE